MIPRFHRIIGRIIGAWVLCGMVLCACAASAPEPAVQEAPDPVEEAISNGDWETARLHYVQRLMQNPKDCRALYHLGYIWGQLDNRIAEIQFYEQAIDCGYTTDDRLFFNLGMAYADRGDFELAVGAFERAASVRPDNPDNYLGLGLMAQAMGRSQQAEASWKQALAKDSAHWESHLALVRLYLDQSRWDEALEHLEAVEAGDPENSETEDLRETLMSRQALEYDR